MPAVAGMTVFFTGLLHKNDQNYKSQHINKGVMPAKAGIPFVFSPF